MNGTTAIDLWAFILLAAASGMLFYIYLGYPLLVALLARWKPMVRTRGEWTGTVSVVISAHNEARTLPEKIRNLLSLQDSGRIVEILIGSDGSTDGTAETVAALNEPRVRVLATESRRGKPAVLNDLIPRCRGDVVLLADARQEFAPDFLTACLANFADGQVGVVSGELVLRATSDQSTAAEGIGVYWRYEKFLRKMESQFRGVPGATGACYAIRRSLFQPISEQTILDDVAIPMTIVAQGYRCVFERGAIAYDRPSQSTRQEAIRKRRTIAGAAQLIRLYPSWLLPGRHPLGWEFVSHKLLRLASPVMLVMALVSNLWLAGRYPFSVLLALQFCLYLGAGVGWLYQQRGRRSAVFGPALMFLTLNLTTIAALWDACRQRYRVTWQKAV